MKTQSGATSIIMTSLMMSLILVFVMTSAKGIFYQLKDSNNQIDSRRSYWRAEGGLECAYAKMLASRKLTHNFGSCIELLDLDELSAERGRPNIIYSRSGFVTLSKAFYLPRLQIKSPITTRSHLLVNGNLKVSPHVGDRINSAEWECYSIRYAGDLYALSYATSPIMLQQVSEPNTSHADVLNDPKCADSHFTRLAWQAKDTQKDFLFKPEVDPFEEVFNLGRSQWFTIMSDTSRIAHVPITLTNELPPKASLLPTPRFNDSCASQILTLIRSFHDLIWVYGGCELLEQDIASINLAIERYLDSGLLLVLHNGIVSISSQQPLNGVIYHLVTSDSLQFTDWPKTANDKPPSRVSQTIAQLPTAQFSKQQISYFQHGSFYPLGGLILDAPNYYAVVNGELNTKYSQSISESVAKYFHSLNWARGGWYDL
ncbi:hypothetical protein MHN79_10860 [Vibrio sp. Of14-4]|uniref:hypothetical protein n=1 Tax=Vibrio sp. Of14-4 TaxID=2724878 RepID=UPI001EF2EECA|nr:hypothetical protein [Vibrio sp. Of14-4]MCG7489990.1 hypothetical protein [Vibrio sp. Of14-4]